MQRKPAVPDAAREREDSSVISAKDYQKWFQQIWNGVTGAQPKIIQRRIRVELAERLIRMFSFVGDTVLDPFMGTGTTALAASKWGTK